MNPAKLILTIALGCGIVLTMVSFVSSINRLCHDKAGVATDSERLAIPADPDGTFGGTAFGSFGSTNEMSTSSTRYRFQSDPATKNDLGGISHVSPNTSIHWRSEYLPDAEGASVASVLEAARDRMSFIQSTPQASDVNARALFALQKAIDTLDGRSDLTDTILGTKP